MPNEELQKKIEELTNKINKIENLLNEHNHTGYIGKEIELFNINGLFPTVTVAGELTAKTAQPAKRLIEQFLIDTTTATKKLYIFDAAGNVWRSVTIA